MTGISQRWPQEQARQPGSPMADSRTGATGVRQVIACHIAAEQVTYRPPSGASSCPKDPSGHLIIVSGGCFGELVKCGGQPLSPLPGRPAGGWETTFARTRRYGTSAGRCRRLAARRAVCGLCPPAGSSQLYPPWPPPEPLTTVPWAPPSADELLLSQSTRIRGKKRALAAVGNSISPSPGTCCPTPTPASLTSASTGATAYW
jgi:hypothetical protein